QDLLGEIHDRDVQVPALEDHLRWLDEREGEAARTLLAAADRAKGAANGGEHAYRSFRRRFEAGRRADERPGIVLLAAILRRERAELYERFLSEWRRLREEGFRARLEAVLGLGLARTRGSHSSATATATSPPSTRCPAA